MAAWSIGCRATPETTTESRAPILKLEELSFTDIDRLDRQKSVFVLAFGNLEEHGPHLPVGSDYFQVIGLRDGMLERLRRQDADHTFVLVPLVPLGEGGFNDLARQFDHVGTFGIRFETLRAVATDLGASIANMGFQHIWLLHFHGMPFHNIAFTQAAAYVTQRYNAHMVNLTSLIFGAGFYSSEVVTQHVGPDWETELGLTGHADMTETAANLYLRGDLVKPEYKTLPPLIVKDFEELGRLYQRTEFQGYMGAPGRASAALGQDLINDLIERGVGFANRALAGEDLSGLPVFPDVLPR